MKWGICLALGVLTLGVTACGSQAAAPVQWTGQSVSDATGLVQELNLSVQVKGRSWLGTYTVGAVPGSFDGEVDADGALTAVLAPSPDCTYGLTGTVTGDRLAGAFTPAVCPGGSGGTWDLARE